MSLDPNVWYGIQTTNTYGFLQSSGLYDVVNQTLGGTVYFSGNAPADPYHNFQFAPSPVENGTYAIRPAGQAGRMCINLVACSKKDSTCVVSGLGVWPCNSASASWRVEQWPSTRNYMIWNTALGKDWALSVFDPRQPKGNNSWVALNSTQSNENQQYMQMQFVKQGAVVNASYSTIPGVSTPAATLMAPATPSAAVAPLTQASPPSAPLPSLSPPPPSSISGGGIAGIVVGILCGIAIILTAIILLLVQRRRRRASPPAELPNNAPDRGAASSAMPKYAPLELDTARATVEAPGNVVDEKRRLGPQELPAS